MGNESYRRATDSHLRPSESHIRPTEYSHKSFLALLGLALGK